MNESPQWGGHGFNEVPQLDAAGASPQWFLTGCSLGGFRLTPDQPARTQRVLLNDLCLGHLSANGT